MLMSDIWPLEGYPLRGIFDGRYRRVDGSYCIKKLDKYKPLLIQELMDGEVVSMNSSYLTYSKMYNYPDVPPHIKDIHFSIKDYLDPSVYIYGVDLKYKKRLKYTNLKSWFLVRAIVYKTNKSSWPYKSYDLETTERMCSELGLNMVPNYGFRELSDPKTIDLLDNLPSTVMGVHLIDIKYYIDYLRDSAVVISKEFSNYNNRDRQTKILNDVV